MADISVDQLADAITKAVREYTEDVSEAIDRKVDEVAENIRATTTAEAPKMSGKYAKGFKVTKQGNRRYVWNKKDHRRVHLLEFGHAKLGGGRVQAYPHLRPAYDKHVGELEDGVKRIIRNGGGT
ncbi:HK97 gp10 family phage protein [Paenibacillus ehimensis]|uniref:HK97 gp10 family phage protein n=1 Tax=Paenibacillus ehimensis TaxID=79264 RepID=A0ABT8VHV2_9BACL|nr:HK97 gp10 family phage protein [Paenibacillus ehimensis]MDO3680564.1 HK97 gp10 family phage protein [Paenibacillus ehimensis]